MAQQAAEVTWKKADADRIPDALDEGVVLVVDLERRGVLRQIGERLKIRRKGGFCGFDVFLILLLYFASGHAVGIRKFWDMIRGCALKVAAIAKRRSLASPASISRALAAVEPELLRPEAEWLLSEGAGIDEVLSHPAVQSYDAQGRGWHIFDFDPTVTTLRQRALPQGDDLPEPRRRAKRMAAPGYSGRKRGEVQFSRGTLQHAGSSAWLQASLGPGNGDGRAALDAALAVVVRTCERLKHPLDQSLMRMDGGFGWVPDFAACRAHGVPFITRLTRPEMFDQPDVLRELREGTWHVAPDSLSGPQRSALDLGIVSVTPGRNTRRVDGSRYEPVAVRVVVSRYPRTEKDKKVDGYLLDGWQYEMFAVDVPVDALPAADAVAWYFGRAGQENRFAQEDRELGLDRIFSYEPAGQEFAVMVGLFVWNVRLVRGFELDPPPVLRPAQAPYVDSVDLRSISPALEITPEAPVNNIPPTQEETPPKEVTDRAACSAPASVRLPADPASGLAAPTVVTGLDDGNAAGRALPSAVPASPEVEASAKTRKDEVLKELSHINWRQTLRNHPGWSWDPTTGDLLCIGGEVLTLTTVRKGEHAQARTNIIFRRPAGGCNDCQTRSACLNSEHRPLTKHVELSVPSSTARKLKELLGARRRSTNDAHRMQDATPVPPPRPGKSLQIEPLAPAVVLLAVLPSLFLAAAARALFRTAAYGLNVEVPFFPAPPRQPRPTLLAASVADKQHRRKTWRQLFEHYALDPDAQVSVRISAGDSLRRLLDGHAQEVPE